MAAGEIFAFLTCCMPLLNEIHIITTHHDFLWSCIRSGWLFFFLHFISIQLINGCHSDCCHDSIKFSPRASHSYSNEIQAESWVAGKSGRENPRKMEEERGKVGFLLKSSLLWLQPQTALPWEAYLYFSLYFSLIYIFFPIFPPDF